MKIVYTLHAQQDLDNIYKYIAYSLLEPSAAENTSRRIMEHIRSLEFMPERCSVYKDEPWHSKGLRFIPIKNYVVFFMIDSEHDKVIIVRILYGKMDINRQLNRVDIDKSLFDSTQES